MEIGDHGSGSPPQQYESNDSISSMCSSKSYTTNQEDTNWCAAHTTSRLLAKLLIPSKDDGKPEGEYEKIYENIGRCLLDKFTSSLQRESPFLYDKFIYDIVSDINKNNFKFDSFGCDKYNKYLTNKQFKVFRIQTPNKRELEIKLPKILSIGGTSEFFEIFNNYKNSIPPNAKPWEAYNARYPNQVDKPYGHSLFLKSCTDGILRIKDSDGYGYFDVPYDLIKLAIKEIIYLKPLRLKTARGIRKSKKQKHPTKNTRKKNKKHY